MEAALMVLSCSLSTASQAHDILVYMQTRADVQAIKDRLDRGLTALAAAVKGNPDFAAEQLDDLKPVVLPLLASPLVGEGSAYDAAYALAQCLPTALRTAAYAVASALQMVIQSQQQGILFGNSSV